MRRKAELDGLEARKQLFDEELKERSVILRYLGMDEEKRFDTEAILRESGRRLRETAELKRKLEKEEDTRSRVNTDSSPREKYWSFRRSWKKNLPGLACILCMEWSGSERTGAQRRKSGACPQKSISSVCADSLRREADILAGQKGAVFTSFPVPVVVREDLEESGRLWKLH